MGMLKEGVRLDRVRGGRQKYRRNPSAVPYQLPHSSMMGSGGGGGSSGVGGLGANNLGGAAMGSGVTSLDDIKILEVLQAYEPDPLNVGHGGIDLMNRSSNGGVGGDEKMSSASAEVDSHEMLSVLSSLYDKELVNIIR